jgi:hypothetical protein
MLVSTNHHGLFCLCTENNANELQIEQLLYHLLFDSPFVFFPFVFYPAVQSIHNLISFYLSAIYLIFCPAPNHRCHTLFSFTPPPPPLPPPQFPHPLHYSHAQFESIYRRTRVAPGCYWGGGAMGKRWNWEKGKECCGAGAVAPCDSGPDINRF